mgnify:FL=1
MARYDVLRAWFQTPNGKACVFYYREGTNDFNTANSCLGDNDEYQLRGRRIEGLALDIGGYLGSVAIPLLIDNPNATVICVEPITENLDLIARNAKVNGVSSRLTLIPGAVGKSGDPVSIAYRFEGGENELHHAFVGNANTVQADAVPHQTISYPALGIRDLVGGQDVEWAKVDAEGGEWGFLDSPDLAHLATIVGEFHPTHLPDGAMGSQVRLRALLEPTHAVTFTGPDEGPGGFTANRR